MHLSLIIGGRAGGHVPPPPIQFEVGAMPPYQSHANAYHNSKDLVSETIYTK